MKRVLSLIIVAVMVLALCFSASAQGGQQILSEMPDEELLAFLEESGVVIPEVYESDEDCIAFVRYVIGKVEEDYSARFHYGATYLASFAESIKAAVVEY